VTIRCGSLNELGYGAVSPVSGIANARSSPWPTIDGRVCDSVHAVPSNVSYT
jgi:hypothetical protein